MSEGDFHLEVIQEDRFRFRVEVGGPDGIHIPVAEGPPLGAEGDGPSPSELLGAAVGGCLSASLLFCLDKAKIPVDGIRTSVHGKLGRNEEGRLRIVGLEVELSLDTPAEDPQQVERCVDIFEKYCTVTESVRAGIPVSAAVTLAPSDRDSE